MHLSAPVLPPLPIDPLLPELVAALRHGGRVVLEAPPGAGKTTRVPRALLDAGMLDLAEALVLQPRRLAARLAARRVAEELGEPLGQRVGYQVRFEERVSPQTRIRFITEGLLNRRLIRDPLLHGVDVVILDEFHERHLSSDVGLALLRHLQRTARPDLKLIVMSATLDADPIADFLHAPRLRSDGRRFPVRIEHLPQPDSSPLPSRVSLALERLLAQGLEGHVLVFLPGAAEIRRCIEACLPLADQHHLLLVPLHGELSAEDQDRAVRTSDRRKVVFSTNVAETSVTLEGIEAVIDSGLARVASHSPWSGLPVLQLSPVSQASAEQRAGRAGRLRPGRAIRLFTQADLLARPRFQAPEITRLDLAEVVLELRGSGITALQSFAWLEPPPPAALEAADALLLELGASDSHGHLTAVGKRMLEFPVHPRQARLLVEAEARGIAAEGALLAALLGERELVLERRARGPGPELPPPISRQGRSGGLDLIGPSDLLARLDLFQEATRGGLHPSRLRDHGLDVAAAHAVDRARQQLLRAMKPRSSRPPNERALEDAMLKAIAAGYLDRVARRRSPRARAEARTGRSSDQTARELIFARGGVALLDEHSVVRDFDTVVALEADARSEGRHDRPRVRLASALDPAWLFELCPDRIETRAELRWNSAAERVERFDVLANGNLILEESRGRLEPGEAYPVLWQAARQAGPGAFVPEDALLRWKARVALLAGVFPDQGYVVPTDAEILEVLSGLCELCESFAELREADLLSSVRALLPTELRQKVENLAPDRLRLPGGRSVRIEYPEGLPPTIASRLQDFFGMVESPTLAAGRVALLVHLLAPNHRAVQVTTDLAGFWSRHYPSLRRELSRLYPRHSWPESPLEATPPPPGRQRR